MATTFVTGYTVHCTQTQNSVNCLPGNRLHKEYRQSSTVKSQASRESSRSTASTSADKSKRFKQRLMTRTCSQVHGDLGIIIILLRVGVTEHLSTAITLVPLIQLHTFCV